MQDTPASSLDLQVVMPIYNEQKAIGGVIADGGAIFFPSDVCCRNRRELLQNEKLQS